MTEKCLTMIDAVFQCTHIFLGMRRESLLNGTSDLWILRCFTDTETSAIRHAVELWRKNQFTAFLVQKTPQKNLENLFYKEPFLGMTVVRSLSVLR